MDYLQVSPLGAVVGYAYRIAALFLAVAAFIVIRWSHTHSPRPGNAIAVWAGILGILHPGMWIMGEDLPNGAATVLQVPMGGAERMRVLLTDFKPLIGKYKFGRIVFSSGHSAVFSLGLLEYKK